MNPNPPIGLTAKNTKITKWQSRNQELQGLTAEYAEYAENRIPSGSPSAYSAYSAVCLFPVESSPPMHYSDSCSAEKRGAFLILTNASDIRPAGGLESHRIKKHPFVFVFFAFSVVKMGGVRYG